MQKQHFVGNVLIKVNMAFNDETILRHCGTNRFQAQAPTLAQNRVKVVAQCPLRVRGTR